MAVFLCYGMIQRQESQYKIEKRVYLTYTPISKEILRAIRGRQLCPRIAFLVA